MNLQSGDSNPSAASHICKEKLAKDPELTQFQPTIKSGLWLQLEEQGHHHHHQERS